MFNKKFEERLELWRQFRLSLETSSTPIEDVIELYSKAPLVSIQVDPYNISQWLTPWELLYENQYCDFSKILAICYSLQLTERFMDEDFEIHICTNNKESSTHYLLFFQNKVIGYDWTRAINKDELPPNLQSQTVYSMPKLL
jgi:hypothetical protein